MIVYGDAVRSENTQRLIAELSDESHRLCEAGSGTQLLDLATSLLISTGELSQGLMDEQFARLGCDEWIPLSERCARLQLAAAALAIDGYTSERNAAFRHEINSLSEFALPTEVTIKTPEGYAFYAVFPRLYAIAAQTLAKRNPAAITVIGLRSIGTSLAAIVAYSAGVDSPPISVRPQGHPFDRHLEVSEALTDRILQHSNGCYAIVDEGPGLSGSSFLAVANWLVDHGVQEEQLDFFPSHGNEPGSQISAANLARWRRVRRHYVDFATIHPKVIDEVKRELPIGHQKAVWNEISAGRWRNRMFATESQWPPAQVQQERRKFLLECGGTTWLAKFAGLGRYGRNALERGQRLSSAGLIPPVQGLRNGFVIQNWLADARPLLEPQLLNSTDQIALLETVARYLEFEADEFRAKCVGSDSRKLWEMARFNISAQFGSEYEDALRQLEHSLEWIGSSAHPVNTDNKMQPWEWLHLCDGSWLKADALDHHSDHQCIGPQDIAWDVAGAVCELELDEDEAAQLRARLSRYSRACRSSVGAVFYEVCYAAFQLGYCTLAARSLEYLPDEKKRFAKRRDFYAGHLRRLQLTSRCQVRRS